MADVLASASANANTDVRGLGQAFQYVAPIAGALGYSIEDTSKAIGLMANSGIKSTKAGTALRKMMNSLAKPTDKAKKLMDEYGISLVDSEGNMKSFDKVMLDLRKGLRNLSEEQQAQAASTIFGQEAMAGALAIVNASEEDYQKLTKAIKESDGSAKNMAKTMQDNLQGSIKELRSMMEDLFITTYKNLQPALVTTTDKAKDLTKWFANLSPETQTLITKFGLLAFASGPVISATGRITEGLGKTFTAVGDVSKAIGIATNGGTLAAALSSLGPGAIAGVAIAGIGAVAYGIHHFKNKAEEATEVNLELAESFTEQAKELEVSVETFDKLSEKANISNKELAELNDLNKKISQSSNPGEIEELQNQYNYLAEKSGLSKEELEKLFKANDDIIKQSPDVQKAVSDEGNAFVESTDKVKEYINSLYEMSMLELEAERTKQLAKEKKIREELIVSQEHETKIRQSMNDLMDAYNGKISDSEQRIFDINNELKHGKRTDEERVALVAERQILEALANGDLERASELYVENIGKMQEMLGKQQETTQSKQEELDKILAIDMEMANILLKQVGINEEGEKGLQKLDETIAKNQEEIKLLEEKKQTGEGLTEEEQKRLGKLIETTEKQKETKKYLYDELGIYKDLNSLANDRLSELDEEGRKKIENLAKTYDLKNAEKDIVAELEKKSSKLTDERKQLEENREKQGANKKEIDKQISSLDVKIGKQAEAKKELLKELGIWGDLDQKTKDNINNEIKRGNAAGNTKDKLDSQGRSIDANNKKTDAGIEKEKERTAEAGKSVNKSVNVTDNRTIDGLNKRASAPRDKNVNLKAKNVDKVNRQASSPVTKVVNFVGRGLSKLKFWAKGTPPSGHPGGHAVLGDGGGSELVRLPDGRHFLSANKPTLYPDLPKGTHVTPHRATKKILKNIPRYAQGTENWESSLRNSEFARLLAVNSKSDVIVKSDNADIKKLLQATMQQNNILLQLLKLQDKTIKAIESGESDIIMDSRIVGELIGNRINKNINEDDWAKGGSY